MQKNFALHASNIKKALQTYTTTTSELLQTPGNKTKDTTPRLHGQRFRMSHLKNAVSTGHHWKQVFGRRMIAMSLLDSSNICTNDNQVDQNAAECVDERAALANLIANLTLDTEENKTLKQLKKANASLTQELKSAKLNLDETNRENDLLTGSRDQISTQITLQDTLQSTPKSVSWPKASPTQASYGIERSSILTSITTPYYSKKEVVTGYLS
ncbi:hypothetical protein Tco_1404787 [Tanacetum coccineum]